MSDKNLFLIYLGRTGAGPKFTLDFSRAIINDTRIEKFELIISKQDLLKQELVSLKSDIQIFDTPNSKKESVTKILIFTSRFIKALRIAKKNKIKNFLFPMTHIWNPLAMILIKIIIPKSVIFYISHDAVIHPGEKNAKLQYQIMQIEIALSYKIITLTQNVKEIISKKWKKKEIIVLEHPVYDFGKITEPRSLSPVPTFLFFGRIVEYKGLDLFVNAINIFKEKVKNFKVIIAGSGEIKKEILEKINKINNIELINGYIDEKEIPEIWDKSDICVLPYTEASQSGVVAIAINKAMPCIITPVSGLVEQCEIKDLETTFAIMSENITPESFANKMSQILNKDLYKKLSQNAIKFQKRLGWDKWIEEIIK